LWIEFDAVNASKAKVAANIVLRALCLMTLPRKKNRKERGVKEKPTREPNPTPVSARDAAGHATMA
jgi:hypothetical protein